MGFLYSSLFRVTDWVSYVISDGFPAVLFSIQSHRLGFLCAQSWVSCTLLHSESQVGFPVCSVIGFLYSSSFRVTGWVSCVLSDRFPVLFFIHSHRLGFLCAQWWVSCILLHSEPQVGFPVCSVMGFLYSSPFRATTNPWLELIWISVPEIDCSQDSDCPSWHHGELGEFIHPLPNRADPQLIWSGFCGWFFCTNLDCIVKLRNKCCTCNILYLSNFHANMEMPLTPLSQQYWRGRYCRFSYFKSI